MIVHTRSSERNFSPMRYSDWYACHNFCNYDTIIFINYIDSHALNTCSKYIGIITQWKNIIQYSWFSRKTRNACLAWCFLRRQTAYDGLARQSRKLYGKLANLIFSLRLLEIRNLSTILGNDKAFVHTLVAVIHWLFIHW